MEVRVCDSGLFLTIEADSHFYRFHAIWLRDNSPDETTRDPLNGQKLITLSEFPSYLKISSARVDGKELVCQFLPENIEVRYCLEWLLDHTYDKKHPGLKVTVPETCILWDTGLSEEVPQANILSLEKEPNVLKSWLSSVRSYGFAKITGLDPEPGQLFRVVGLFGYVRETNYGRHFEVRTEVNPVNLAYTSLGLQAHTDNPYREPVPTLQVLSCLENSAEGGESMVVDGFSISLKLKEEDPDGFLCLANYPARFSYSGSTTVSLGSRRPMIEMGPDKEIQTIRFNSRSAAPLVDVPFEFMETYYRAYKKMSELVDLPENQVSFKLKSGEAFIVDNTRVLHSRKEYSGSGSRWLQGCYADKDSLHSKLVTLEKSIG